MIATLTSNRRVIGLGSERLGELAELADGGPLEGGGEVGPASVRLGPPVPDPQKIICLGLNYRDHAEEAGIEPPSAPMFFAKFANSLIGPDDEIVPPKVAERVDYEAELAVVIGRSARNVGAEEALSYVAGAMAFNDVSARDLQLENPLWTGGKAIDTFAPCGPALVTLDTLGDLSDLAIRTWVNGDQVQDGSSSAMVFGVPETIAFLSRVMTLVPGDIIATGTPAGVGSSRTPPLFLRPGDLVEVEIDKIGRLSNRLTDPI
jgi:2-keto-4-pentenoate hydratase/2-oxohepta-3-ene-1,7-dioic acid hydratase in catechol pathway